MPRPNPVLRCPMCNGMIVSVTPYVVRDEQGNRIPVGKRCAASVHRAGQQGVALPDGRRVYPLTRARL